MKRCFYCNKIIWFWQAWTSPFPAIDGELVEICWHRDCVDNIRKKNLDEMKKENEKYDREKQRKTRLGSNMDGLS